MVVTPILWGAIHAGLSGWIPTNDAAPAVLRAKYSLGMHPSLVGLYAWPPSQFLHIPTFYPGPWQLWWMSVPIRVLGTTWGPLLSMAALNSAAVVLVGWRVRRFLGFGYAVNVLFALGLVIWSVGATTFSSPVPVVAIVGPLCGYFFLAWLVGLGDRDSLPYLVLFANYLVLTHPGTAVLVAAFGVGALVLGLAPAANRHIPKAQRRDYVKRFKKPTIIACGVTVTLWLPALYQQWTSHPGNLTNLYQGTVGNHSEWLGITGSFRASMALFTQRAFWFRGSTEHSFLTLTAGLPSFGLAIVACTVLVGAFALAGYLARRSGDGIACKTALFGLGALGASWLHVKSAPYGQYFLPMWGVAMFVTFALAVSIVRALPTRPFRITVIPIAVLMVFSIPATPIPHSTAGSAQQIRDSRSLNNAIIPQLSNKRLVRIAPAFTGMYPYAAALAVALDHAEIPMCEQHLVSFIGRTNPQCAVRGQALTVTFQSADRFIGLHPGERELARIDRLSIREQKDFQSLSFDVFNAVSALGGSGRPLTVPARFKAEASKPDRSDPDATNVDYFSNPSLINTNFDARDEFAALVRTLARSDPQALESMGLSDLTSADLERWASLLQKKRGGIVVIAGYSDWTN